MAPAFPTGSVPYLSPTSSLFNNIPTTGTSGRQPEKSLMSAVLLDAVECFQKYLLLHDEYSNRLFKEAENWILDNDREWLFSFINICDALDN